MYGPVPPSAPRPFQMCGEKDLAALCVGGKITAGVELCERLARQGREVSITTLIRIAVPTLKVTFVAFDCLCDALDAFRAIRDQEDSPP